MKLVLARAGKKIFLVNIEKIDWIEAERNYMRLYCGEESFLIRRTMTNLEKQLTGDQFVRINRSIIINVHRIAELRLNKNSEYLVILDNDRSWVWGRRFRRNLERMLV